MKISILISFIIHVLFIAMILILQPEGKSIPMQDIYHVTLVQARTITPRYQPDIIPARIEPIQEPKTIVKEPELKQVEGTPIRPVEEMTQSVSALLSTESGTSSEPIQVSVDDFPFMYYLNIIRYRIQEQWDPPYQDIGGDRIISAVVGFRVMRDGEIQDIVLERSSGRFLFDVAAQRAVYAVNPLPALPEAYTNDRLTVHIEFEAVW